jgi:hypothetical protein
MNTLFSKITDLNKMIIEGRALEGFDKYYHNGVIMQENESVPTIGKIRNREREAEFLNSITQFRRAVPLSVTVGENVTMVEWHFDYTHKDWGIRNYKQISVQKWLDGKIISEKFYYGS